MSEDMSVIAFAGAKGGVGKTTSCINVGAALSSAGLSVALVELDLAMANVVDFLEVDGDIENGTTLHDVLADEAALVEARYRTPIGIDVFPSGVDLEGFAATALDPLSGVINTVSLHYDVVLLDIGAGVNAESTVPLGLADGVILVSTPRVASLRDAEKTKELVDHVDGSLVGLVLTKTGTGTAPDHERLGTFVGTDLLGHVPLDERVPVAQDRGRPVLALFPDSPAAAGYRDVAAALTEYLEVTLGPTTAEDRTDEAPSETDHSVDEIDEAKEDDGFEWVGDRTHHCREISSAANTNGRGIDRSPERGEPADEVVAGHGKREAPRQATTASSAQPQTTASSTQSQAAASTDPRQSSCRGRDEEPGSARAPEMQGDDRQDPESTDTADESTDVDDEERGHSLVGRMWSIVAR